MQEQRPLDEPRTIYDLRKLGVEIVLSPDKSRVLVRDEQSADLTPEVRAAIAKHHGGFLKVLLLRQAASFVSHRLEEAGLSWHDPAYDAEVSAFNGGDHQERLNEAWSEAEPGPVKDVLRLCTRSGVRAIPSHPDAPPSGRRAENQHDGAASPERRQGPYANLPDTSREPKNTDEINPQLPLETT